jgi:hypothetical protein
MIAPDVEVRMFRRSRILTILTAFLAVAVVALLQAVTAVPASFFAPPRRPGAWRFSCIPPMR